MAFVCFPRLFFFTAKKYDKLFFEISSLYRYTEMKWNLCSDTEMG